MGVALCHRSFHYGGIKVGILFSGDSWMYPYQRTPMGHPYISHIYSGYLWVSYPQESLLEHNKYHGSTRTLGVHPIVP